MGQNDEDINEQHFREIREKSIGEPDDVLVIEEFCLVEENKLFEDIDLIKQDTNNNFTQEIADTTDMTSRKQKEKNIKDQEKKVMERLKKENKEKLKKEKKERELREKEEKARLKMEKERIKKEEKESKELEKKNEKERLKNAETEQIISHKEKDDFDTFLGEVFNFKKEKQSVNLNLKKEKNEPDLPKKYEPDKNDLENQDKLNANYLENDDGPDLVDLDFLNHFYLVQILGKS